MFPYVFVCAASWRRTTQAVDEKSSPGEAGAEFCRIQPAIGKEDIVQSDKFMLDQLFSLRARKDRRSKLPGGRETKRRVSAEGNPEEEMIPYCAYIWRRALGSELAWGASRLVHDKATFAGRR